MDRSPFATATETLADLRARKVSAVELLDAAIARVDALDGKLNAVIAKDYEVARRDAQAADAALAKGEGGALCGLPMTVKESYDLTGHMTTWGVERLKGYRATVDALAVQRLKAAGAVVFGKTNVSPMLADWQSDNPVYGRTNNPYDQRYVAGGSSGGSGVALAAGFSALEIGSDIGGSIRIPANFNGVFGHKPSYGLVPVVGHMAGGVQQAMPPLAVAGPLARSAGDLRMALEIIAGPGPEDAKAYSLRLPEPRHDRLSDYRVLILDHHPSAATDVEISDALHALGDRVEKAGATVGRDASILPDLAQAHRTYISMLLTVTTRRADGAPDRPPIDAHAWLGLLDAQLEIRQAWAEVFKHWDVVVAPVFGTTVFPHMDKPDWRERSFKINGEKTNYGDQLAFAGIVNLPNLPSTAFPLGLNDKGLPLGAQAIGPYLEDLTAIAFAGLAASDFTPPKL